MVRKKYRDCNRGKVAISKWRQNGGGKVFARRGERWQDWEEELIMTRRWPKNQPVKKELIKNLSNKNLQRDLRDKEISILLERSVGSIIGKRTALRQYAYRCFLLYKVAVNYNKPRQNTIIEEEGVMPTWVVKVGETPLFQLVVAA